MGYAKKLDGSGWRAVDSEADVGPDEVYSADQPPLVGPTLADKAMAALARTDSTVMRITEAVSLGTCALSNPDVVAFMLYRRKLRDIVSGVDTTSTVLPPEPGTQGGVVFPAGT